VAKEASSFWILMFFFRFQLEEIGISGGGLDRKP
jgi:hypothetical protein